MTDVVDCRDVRSAITCKYIFSIRMSDPGVLEDGGPDQTLENTTKGPGQLEVERLFGMKYDVR